MEIAEENTKKEKWLTTQEVLDVLRQAIGRDDLLTLRTVQTMIKRKDFGEPMRMGHYWLVKQVGVEAYLERSKQGVDNG